MMVSMYSSLKCRSSGSQVGFRVKGPCIFLTITILTWRIMGLSFWPGGLRTPKPKGPSAQNMGVSEN